MDKNLLEQYEDACALIIETEQEIKEIEQQKKRVMRDKVKGSMDEFPYTQRSFSVEGIIFADDDKSHLMKKEKILRERKANAENIKMEVEEFLNAIPLRMQRIIKYKVIKKMTWEKIAVRMGRKCTADSVRKEYERFMRKK